MLTLEVVTLDGVKVSEEVYEVIIPTPDGLVAIFPHHSPLISLASPGVISLRKNQNDRDDQMEVLATNGGVVEIDGPHIRLLVDEANHSREISEKEAEEALLYAQEQARQAKDSLSLEKAEQYVQTMQARLKVAQFKKRKR